MSKTNCLVLLLALLVFGYLKSGGRAQCLLGEYEQFDSQDSTNDEPRPRAGPDGSPESSIAYSTLLPHSVRARERIVKSTQLLACEDSYASTRRIAYVQLQAKELSSALKAWRAGTNLASGFESGNMLQDYPMATYFGNSRRSDRLWNAQYALQPAPSWLEKESIRAENFIAFWGDGYLFQGKQADQYFWVGFKM